MGRPTSFAPLLAAALALAGCATHPTSPAPPPTPDRTGTLLLLDRAGDPVPCHSVLVVSQPDPGGPGLAAFLFTDAAGECPFDLPLGRYDALVDPLPADSPAGPPQVAAASFAVRARAWPSLDTLGLVLRMAAASRVSGRVALAGGGDPRGTAIGALWSDAQADSLGDWALADAPPGTWTVSLWHAGYAPQQRTVTVVQPGSSVVLAPVVLQPAGTPAAR